LSKRDLRVAVHARKNGGYTYQIFTMAGEPKTVLCHMNDDSYASAAEAVQAGFQTVAVLNCISGDLI
jgi:hypothetical protein